MSLRDIAELMLARGDIVVSHETIRAWCAKFGTEYARGLRRRAPRPGDKWFLDEVFVKSAPPGSICGERSTRKGTSLTFWSSPAATQRL